MDQSSRRRRECRANGVNGSFSSRGGMPRAEGVVMTECKRVFECRYALCETKTWTGQHDATASRMVLSERAQSNWDGSVDVQFW